MRLVCCASLKIGTVRAELWTVVTSHEYVRNADTLLKNVRDKRETGLARQLNCCTDALRNLVYRSHLLCTAISPVYALVELRSKVFGEASILRHLVVDAPLVPGETPCQSYQTQR